MSTVCLHIVTPSGVYYSGSVDYVSVNAVDGRMGLMRGALPGIFVLKAGTLEYTVGEDKTTLCCGDGILRVDGDVTVITDMCGIGGKVDLVATAPKSDSSDYKYAKARIAAALLKMKDKKLPEDTF